jgi:hypothetical protein
MCPQPHPGLGISIAVHEVSYLPITSSTPAWTPKSMHTHPHKMAALFIITPKWEQPNVSILGGPLLWEVTGLCVTWSTLKHYTMGRSQRQRPQLHGPINLKCSEQTNPETERPAAARESGVRGSVTVLGRQCCGLYNYASAYSTDRHTKGVALSRAAIKR